METAERGANAILMVDLEAQEITDPDGNIINFEMDPFRKRCLLNGLDDIGLTMEQEKNIEAFEVKRNLQGTWRTIVQT